MSEWFTILKEPPRELHRKIVAANTRARRWVINNITKFDWVTIEGGTVFCEPPWIRDISPLLEFVNYQSLRKPPELLRRDIVEVEHTPVQYSYDEMLDATENWQETLAQQKTRAMGETDIDEKRTVDNLKARSEAQDKMIENHREDVAEWVKERDAIVDKGTLGIRMVGYNFDIMDEQGKDQDDQVPCIYPTYELEESSPSWAKSVLDNLKGYYKNYENIKRGGLTTMTPMCLHEKESEKMERAQQGYTTPLADKTFGLVMAMGNKDTWENIWGGHAVIWGSVIDWFSYYRSALQEQKIFLSNESHINFSIPERGIPFYLRQGFTENIRNTPKRLEDLFG